MLFLQPIASLKIISLFVPGILSTFFQLIHIYHAHSYVYLSKLLGGGEGCRPCNARGVRTTVLHPTEQAPAKIYR